MTKTEQLASWIRRHETALNVRTTEDAVTFEIEWSKPATGETGTDEVTVRTLREARIALGY